MTQGVKINGLDAITRARAKLLTARHLGVALNNAAPRILDEVAREVGHVGLPHGARARILSRLRFKPGKTPLSIEIGTDDPAGAAFEHGTVATLAQPWLRRAVIAAAPTIKHQLKRASGPPRRQTRPARSRRRTS